MGSKDWGRWMKDGLVDGKVVVNRVFDAIRKYDDPSGIESFPIDFPMGAPRRRRFGGTRDKKRQKLTLFYGSSLSPLWTRDVTYASQINAYINQGARDGGIRVPMRIFVLKPGEGTGFLRPGQNSERYDLEKPWCQDTMPTLQKGRVEILLPLVTFFKDRQNEGELPQGSNLMEHTVSLEELSIEGKRKEYHYIGEGKQVTERMGWKDSYSFEFSSIAKPRFILTRGYDFVGETFGERSSITNKTENMQAFGLISVHKDSSSFSSFSDFVKNYAEMPKTQHQQYIKDGLDASRLRESANQRQKANARRF